MSFSILLEKENFKFSCSHFTILSSDRAERLHGHNYYIAVKLMLSSIDPSLGMGFDFNLVKPLIRQIADHLDEFVLIPESSPYLKVEQNSERVTVRFLQKYYDFPAEDVRILPVANITSEELARYIATQLRSLLKLNPELVKRIQSVETGIQETRGQTVKFRIDI
jgi:6-pyruvoyltetrahydropterin/6-carboxytetrahydropterin synthase